MNEGEASEILEYAIRQLTTVREWTLSSLFYSSGLLAFWLVLSWSNEAQNVFEIRGLLAFVTHEFGKYVNMFGWERHRPQHQQIYNIEIID